MHGTGILVSFSIYPHVGEVIKTMCHHTRLPKQLYTTVLLPGADNVGYIPALILVPEKTNAVLPLLPVVTSQVPAAWLGGSQGPVVKSWRRTSSRLRLWLAAVWM